METTSKPIPQDPANWREKIGLTMFYLAIADAIALTLFLSVGYTVYSEMGLLQKAYYNSCFSVPSALLSITSFLLTAFAHLILPKSSRLRVPTSIFTFIQAFGLVLLLFFVPYVIFPSPEYVSIRSKISRVKTDMRSISIALESYYADNQSYPPSTLDLSEQVPFSSNISLPTFAFKGAGLTTPIAYYSGSLPADHLSVDWKPRSEITFAYWNANNKGWILLSPGPDGVFDIDFDTLQKLYDPSLAGPSQGLVARMYDATNGIISGGDIMRVKM